LEILEELRSLDAQGDGEVLRGMKRRKSSRNSSSESARVVEVVGLISATYALPCGAATGHKGRDYRSLGDLLQNSCKTGDIGKRNP